MELTQGHVLSLLGNPCKLRLGDKLLELKTGQGKSYAFNGQLQSGY